MKGLILMKWLIASDIHGSALFTRQLLERFRAEGADRLLLLGDLLYHGPRNDLPEGYAPKEVIALLNGLKNRIFCVRGNCEAEVDQMVLQFPVLSDYALLEWNHHLIFVTHGHTHIPANEPWGQDNRYWNPGSVSLPKAGTPHSYMVLEEDRPLWKALE